MSNSKRVKYFKIIDHVTVCKGYFPKLNYFQSTNLKLKLFNYDKKARHLN